MKLFSTHVCAQHNINITSLNTIIYRKWDMSPDFSLLFNSQGHRGADPSAVSIVPTTSKGGWLWSDTKLANPKATTLKFIHIKSATLCTDYVEICEFCTHVLLMFFWGSPWSWWLGKYVDKMSSGWTNKLFQVSIQRPVLANQSMDLIALK